ncbi:endoribonuclease dcr-1 isoform X3 [Adelges cooleyi]|uniref:endoribonuclease dcr-1 isoform X3 n=1 Tax=Adelges cooleyi TaxID=133065 RepID=UPI00217F39E8|nr:endoribonuclease dcr-1 isoform X3 [Adelges cooleyi]
MEESVEEKLENEIIPRDYQLELLEEVKKNNTILYLPTGSGKTYIATMLIKAMGSYLTLPKKEERKRTFFLVNTVPLVIQQASSLKKHLPWSIGTFSGDMKVDFWSQDQWDKIIEECHIIVMTSQIYLNNLHHGYMKMKDANLLIFDECHHAKANHPYRQIMQVYHDSNNQEWRPRILGLTATLINSNCKNIKTELALLQQTFDAAIKTRFSDNIKMFSASPDASIIVYDKFEPCNELSAITTHLVTFSENLKCIISTPKNQPIIDKKDIFYMENPKQATKDLANYFLDINVNFLDSGVYIGYLATWHYIIELEKKKKLSEDMDKYTMLSCVLSQLIITRKLFLNHMLKNSKNIENLSTLKQNASPKLVQFMALLDSVERTDSCLVFVDRRTTAKLLYHFIKECKRYNSFKNIECDFIVGARGLFTMESNESLYKKQQNQDIVKNFHKNTINVLITSEVLEEGIDVPECNYVIRYDMPKNFPSYVQSKGRARSKKSKFIVLAQNQAECEHTQSVYKKMEREIEIVLKHDNIDDSIDDEDFGEVFETKCGTLTSDIAIGIINRYCTSLPQDRFSPLGPEWWLAESEFRKYKLKLPINSAIKTAIDGKVFRSKKNAKKSAAFNACIELYHADALDDNLLPATIKNKPIFKDLNWFPHWVENDVEVTDYKPGTNKMKRIVKIYSPSYLNNVYPQPNKTSYLHVIQCNPLYGCLNDTKYKTFDGLLRSNEHFGIITSKKLPSLSNFPIFLNFGVVNICILVNSATVVLDQQQIKKLEQFHNKLFVDVLGVKKFLMRNYKNEINSYLLVPIIASGENYTINWDVVDIDTFVMTEAPTEEERKAKFYEKYFETPHIISPWYRNIVPIQRYLVTDVHKDMSPESIFPSNNYDTYQDYFEDKYTIRVTNKDQPLIQVKSLGVPKINYLVPRISTGKVDKRTEYIERLIPEFCMWHEFPSVYWFKALMLPTILYRIKQLLLAEDLFLKINQMCGFEFSKDLKPGSLEVDKFYGLEENKKKDTFLPIRETLKCLKNCLDDNVSEWKSKNQPIDLDRQKNTTVLDIINYNTFMHPNLAGKFNADKNTKSSRLKAHEKCKRPRYASYNKEHLEEICSLMIESKPSSDIINNLIKLNILKNYSNFAAMSKMMKTMIHEMNSLNLIKSNPPMLKSLSKHVLNKSNGPKQCDILKAITPACSNDIFHYERMETFGDSFLKFSTSLVLFDAFETENEGVLTELKMKLVGNRNLLYVGKNINLGSFVMVNVFEPSTDWVPPCFSVPEKLINDINLFDQLPSDVLYQIVIPREDKFSGELSEETWTHIETECVRFKEMYDTEITTRQGYTQSDLFLDKQSVSDKMVADSVEALIGTYVYNCGIEGGFKILNGFGIIPNEHIKAYENKPILNNSINSKTLSELLPGYDLLEKRIGYVFKCKKFLLQAMTHPTHAFGFSECYQRLEFLGDAILDFLITTYIIEHCSNKSPGEITDIRSSLVNNITFASLSARIGLHRFLLAESIKLTEAIDRFYEHQAKNNHKIGQEVLYLLEENDCMAAEAIDVPKVLGDLFESLIAAIYLDCGRDLNFVWQFCYQLMEQEIIEFCTNVPKNPIRILHETKLQPVFSKPSAHQAATERGLGTMMQLEIFVDGKKQTIFGFGKNKKEAKLAAAKMALKNLRKML